jgi:hypothetical protein
LPIPGCGTVIMRLKRRRTDNCSKEVTIGRSAAGLPAAKVTLGLDADGYPELPAADCGVTEFLVINPHG